MPFGNYAIVEVVTGIVGGKRPLNPKKRAFYLRYFKDGKILTCLVSYALLLVSFLVNRCLPAVLICMKMYHIARRHASGNYSARIKFSRVECSIVIQKINAIVMKYEGDARYIMFLKMIYDSLAKGNEQ